MSKSATITKNNKKPTKTATKKPAIDKSALTSKVAYYILYVSDMSKATEFYKSIGLNAGFESPEWTEFDAGIKFALHLNGCATKGVEAPKAIETGLSFGVTKCQDTYKAFKA